MITKEKKTNVINANATHENDTGSPEVQVAIWTERIRELGRQAPPHARLPGQEGHRALSCTHREAEHPQVISLVQFFLKVMKVFVWGQLNIVPILF